MQLPARSSINHAPGRSQHWDDADDDLRTWIDQVVLRLSAIAGLTGIYLHGSLTMGCFTRPKSDVDLLVVTDKPMSDRPQLARDMLGFFDERPIVGGLELSVVQRSAVEDFEHPAPYLFHFSEKWADEVRSGGSGPQGTDADLAAHCAIARKRGVALLGPPPDEVIGQVPRAAFIDAIVDDLRWITDGGIVESPYYGVLQICRCTWSLADSSAFPSKEEGALWALDHLPEEHHDVIRDALSCYKSSADIHPGHRRLHGHTWDEQPLLAMAAWARATQL